jgi:hypothetical protein
MTKPITQAFWDAIAAAGLHGLPFTADFDAGGSLLQNEDTGHNMSVTPQQVSAIEAVYAAYDPTAPSWTLYQQQAAAALAESDKTVIRCGENQVQVPAAWATYRKALRAIVGATTPGDPTQPLPTRPAYPSNT